MVLGRLMRGFGIWSVELSGVWCDPQKSKQILIYKYSIEGVFC